MSQISIGWLCEPTAKDGEKINSVECKLSFDAITDPLEDEYDAYQLQPRLHKFGLNANLTGHDSINNNVSVRVLSSSLYEISDEIERVVSRIGIELSPFYEGYTDSEKSMVVRKKREELKKGVMMNIFDKKIANEIPTAVDDISLDNLLETMPIIDKIYCNDFHHFLPNAINVRSISYNDVATYFLEVFCGRLRGESINKQLDSSNLLTNKLFACITKDTSSLRDVTLPVAILIELLDMVNLQNKTLRKKLNDTPEETISLISLANFIQKLSQRTQTSISNAIFGVADAYSECRDKIRNNIKCPLEIELILNRDEIVRPKLLSSAIKYIDNFFSDDVKYLGPLRSQPKYLYPINTSIDSTDVGVSGEQTAAVLYVHRKTNIEYLPVANFPPANSESSEVQRNSTSKNLIDAVCEWAQYIGVVDDIRASDHGRLGYSIGVSQYGKIPDEGRFGIDEDIKDELEIRLTELGVNLDSSVIEKQERREFYSRYLLDLTHVGVGVSQVIPILVMGLLSKEDTTLIFEQPELHLHPLVQTRLADFFLSMALLNKQCIIETHSEHLINRLRFRAASAEEPLTDTSKIYFVEKKDGASQFREVVINEYGSIEDWPSGFFDQSYTEAENILMASIKKRKKMRKRKDQ